MNRIALQPICMFLCLFINCFVTAVEVDAQEQPAPARVEEAPVRKFAKTYEDEDLTGKDFSSKNLDNTNFRNANLSNAKFEGASLKNCDFNGAILKGTNFAYADLTGSDLREATLEYPSFFRATLNKVNLSELDLSTLQLNDVKLRGSNLRNVKAIATIYSADFFEADVRGADFSKAMDAPPAIFRKAKYDQFTRWHKNFVPKERGAIFSMTKEEPEEEKKKKEGDTEPPATEKPTPEAMFKKLDGNNDGVLSGKEMKGYKDRDANDDGDLTLEEFLQKKE